MPKILVFLILLVFIVFPENAFAHVFGTMYTLPIPVWLYLFSGAAALIISFLAFGIFLNQPNQNKFNNRVDLSKYQAVKFLIKPEILSIIKSIPLGIFGIIILAGIFGIQDPTLNISPTLFWIIFLLGFSYLSSVFGNFWQYVNPWKILANAVINSKPILKYPKKLGFIPALFFYFLFIWVELISQNAAEPKIISIYIFLYTALNLLGRFLFGFKDWFKYGEFFNVFFGLISLVAPIIFENGKVYLRFPFFGVLKIKVEHVSLLIFILFMLSSTAFDGFRATSAWLSIYYKFMAGLTSETAYKIIQTVFLVFSPGLFLIIYFLAVGIMKLIIRTKLTVISIALVFAPSLIPIALAYNIAHYYTLLLISGQSIIQLISDPLGLGWNLFGTSSYTNNPGIISASFVWNSQVAVIILGHIAAVFLAHLTALKIFLTRKSAMLSQLSMLIVMIIYTVTGLWILSQPLRVGG